MENKTTSLVLKAIVGLIFLLAAVGVYKIATFSDKAADLVEVAKKKAETDKKMFSEEEGKKIEHQVKDGVAGYVVQLTFWLFWLTVALIVASTLYSLVMNPKGLITIGAGVVVFVVLLTVCYFMASDAEVFGSNGEKLLNAKDYNIPSVTKWSGAGINLSMILLLVGSSFFTFDLVKSLIKS